MCLDCNRAKNITYNRSQRQTVYKHVSRRIPVHLQEILGIKMINPIGQLPNAPMHHQDSCYNLVTFNIQNLYVLFLVPWYNRHIFSTKHINTT